MKKIIVALIIPTAIGVMALTNYQFHRKNEVFVEANHGEGVTVEKALSPRLYRADDLTDYSVAVQFEYEAFEADSTAIEEGNRKEEVAESASYHSNKNKEYATNVALTYDHVFVSKYSPMVVYNFENTTLEAVMTQVDALSYSSKIHEIHVYESSLYEATLDDANIILETATPTVELIDYTELSDDRITDYDHFPVETPYKGYGIKIGIFDVGLFDVSHSNFAYNPVEVVYDTNTANNTGSLSLHPTWVGSVIGGVYGIASMASLYFADVNSQDSYMGIEHLIDAGVDLVNMSIAISNVTSTTYDTTVEYYFDYLYTSTKVVMVAAAGNSLNEYGSGGYVGLPALCANVITVGSVDTSGSPSNFSSYKIANDVMNKPNIVAMGDHRQVAQFGVMSGTSLSAPAVTGALGLLFQRRFAQDLPTSLACLAASANDSIIIKTAEVIDLCTYGDFGFFVPTGVTITCTNLLYAGSGFRERTGAGALDIERLISMTADFTPSPVSMTSTNYVTLTSGIYLTAGQTLHVAMAWERTGRVTYKTFLGIVYKTIYSHDKLANLDLAIVNSSGTTWKTYFTVSNSERMDYTCNTTGYFSVKIKPVTDYALVTSVNCAYWVG